ncbi:MAG: IclR family transcriptional regulator [Chloroflexota bacterium]
MEKYAGTQAIARTFGLIKLFDDDNPVWSLPALIEASGLKRTTAFRLLSALEAEGIIQRTLLGDYQLGSELILLGGRAIRANNLRAVAQPHLQKLVQLTTESVTIDLLWLDEANIPMSMVVEEQLGQHLLGLAQYIGSRFPAYATSTGKVLLAWQAPEQLAGFNFQEFKAFTEQTIGSYEALMAELATVRQQGFATVMDELEVGLTAVSAPIFNHHGEIQAAVSAGGPTSRIPQERLTIFAQHVMQQAQAISQAIGYANDSAQDAERHVRHSHAVACSQRAAWNE